MINKVIKLKINTLTEEKEIPRGISPVGWIIKKNIDLRNAGDSKFTVRHAIFSGDVLALESHLL